jgi:hypothetical protein
MNGVCKGPHVQLVYGAIVNVGGYCVYHLSVDQCGFSLRFLFIANEMLGCSLDTGILDCSNCFIHGDAG